jgi:thiol-disulfide isomerase/thioredoxin
MRKTIFTLLLSILTLVCQAQTGIQKVNVNFKGKEYNKLNLEIDLPYSKFICPGESDDRKNWSFYIPDSIYDKHTYMVFNVSKNDSLIHQIAFYVKNNPTKIIGFSLERKSKPIMLVYKETTYEEKVPFYRFKDVITDSFDLKGELDVEIQAGLESYDMFIRGRQETYTQQLAEYIELAKKYPNSHTLISNLVRRLELYQSPNDIKKIYDCFSKERQSSYFGRRISKFITNNHFENTKLPRFETNIEEYIIMDSSKYNLIVFSASWCAPCHRQIPQLKTIYNDLGKQLEITYISIDENETINNWYKLIEKEHIPWRSLIGMRNLQELKEKYFLQSIPYTLLVNPENEIEIVNIQKETDRDRLYKLINDIDSK